MISGICEESSKAKWCFKIKTHEHRFSCLTAANFYIEERSVRNITGCLAEMLFPEFITFLCDFSLGKCANSTSIFIALEHVVLGIILRKSISIKGSIGKDYRIFILNYSSDIIMSGLNNLLK